MDPVILKHYRISLQEYKSIKNLLGHKPSRMELILFSALWSEHCSYKSSIVHLKKLHFDSPSVIKGFGENAGVVDLGKGEKAAFKVESHNHPSMITPYYGASTGVGGILRDIFVMNARPVALANYLCFGDRRDPSLVGLIDGIVRGIGDYGNCIGIPNITGQTEFHSGYNGNVVVNALALGYFGPEDSVMTSQASGVGNLFVYAGSRTGRDGIHGASMASESFHKDTEDKKDTVQIGDPFYGKLLMEACLEAMKKKLVVAAQDMGAAGLTSSSFEMISKAKMGMNLYLDKIPLRDTTMGAEEILLSETQERVLLLIKPGNWNKVKSIFEKWALPVCIIGELTQEPYSRLFWKEKCLVKINPLLLTEKAPRYSRAYEKWKSKYRTEDISQTQCTLWDSLDKNFSLKKPSHSKAEHCLLSVLQDIRACSRHWIYQQYDQNVGARTERDCSFPIGVMRLPHSGRALSVCLGGRTYLMRMDSLEGGKDSVIEPALQLAARGFSPLALTDGLNFGSPENQEVMSQFVACVEGIACASRALSTPVVSGNVSLYNESQEGTISPSPVVAVIGVKDTLDIAYSSVDPVEEENDVYLFTAHQLFCKGYWSELQKESPLFHGSINVKACQQMIKFLKTCSLLYPPSAVYLVGKFGLAYALTRLILQLNKGMKVNTSYPYFQERLYEIILVLSKQKADKWKKKLFKFKKDHQRFSMANLYENKVKEKSSLLSLQSVDLKMEKLGTIIPKPHLYLNDDISLSLKALQEAYKSGWDKNFENLSSQTLKSKRV